MIVLFGAVLALNGADTATVGAVAPQLEIALHIGNTKIGLLELGLAAGRARCSRSRSGCWSTASSGCRCCALSIVLWSVASLLSAFAGSYCELCC